MSDWRTPEHAISFEHAAAEYERSRPTYPSDAVDWILDSSPQVIVDLGAGTGKFTRSLMGRGAEVVAVEPLAGMRAVLEEQLPEVRSLAGSAESIPLPDHSVDVVTVAQAWHWVDETRGLPEVARVLRPGGRLAIIWNLRDEDVPWVERLSAITGRSGAERIVRANFEIGAPFEATERFRTEWPRTMDADLLVELVASRSYVITASPQERADILARVRSLAEHDPDLAGRPTFDLPYNTFAFRATTPG